MLHIIIKNPYYEDIFCCLVIVQNLRLNLYVCSSHSCFQARKNLFMRVVHLCQLLLALLKVLSHLSLAGSPHGFSISYKLHHFNIFRARIISPGCVWNDLTKMELPFSLMAFCHYLGIFEFHMTDT